MKLNTKLPYSQRAKLVNKISAACLRLNEVNAIFRKLEQAFIDEKYAVPALVHETYRLVEQTLIYAVQAQRMLIRIAQVSQAEVPAEQLYQLSAEGKPEPIPNTAHINALNKFEASQTRGMLVQALTDDARMLQSMQERITSAAEVIAFLELRVNDLLRTVPDGGTLIIQTARDALKKNSRQHQQPE